MDVTQRDPLAGFSLEDIINIWLIAAALALLPWALVGGLVRLVAAVKVRIQKKKTPTPQDEPLEVLARLELAHRPFNLNQATFDGQRLWELPLPSPDPAKKWVSGRVSVSFPAAKSLPDDQAREDVENAKRQFQELLNTPAQTHELYQLFFREKRIELRWQPVQPPQLVDKKDAPTVTGVPDEFVYAA